MFSFRTVLLFLVALVAIVGPARGEQGCDSSPSREELYDEQARRSSDSIDKLGRITLDCGTTGGGSGGNNGFVTIIDLSVGLFFLIWVAIGIWIVVVRRQKIMNAAVVKPYPGEMGAKEMGYGMDEKAMSAPAGKLSSGSKKKHKSKKIGSLDVGAFVGIIIAAIVVTVVMICVIYFFYLRHKTKKAQSIGQGAAPEKFKESSETHTSKTEERV